MVVFFFNPPPVYSCANSFSFESTVQELNFLGFLECLANIVLQKLGSYAADIWKVICTTVADGW